jgi:hypothetical protein
MPHWHEAVHGSGDLLSRRNCRARMTAAKAAVGAQTQDASEAWSQK